MSDRTSIEWTDASWNPVRARYDGAIAFNDDDPVEFTRKGWHCEHVSEGCRNCYAEAFNRRLGTGWDYKPGHRKNVSIYLDEKALLAPLKWRKPRKIFVCSMTDLFADFVSDEMIDRVFAVMALCPQHIFQVLTKRPERMRKYLSARESHERMAALLNKMKPSALWNGNVYQGWQELFGKGFLPNVWLGVSVEDQAAADERIPLLLSTPAAVRWLSCEPLLGFVVLSEAWHGESALDAECWGDCNWCEAGLPPLYSCRAGRQTEAETQKGRSGIDWVVAGGESGRGARPMDVEWVRLLRDECASADVPFLFKQWGAWLPAGQVATETGPWKPSCGAPLRTTKKNAGRLLDGVQHDGYPA